MSAPYLFELAPPWKEYFGSVLNSLRASYASSTLEAWRGWLWRVVRLGRGEWGLAVGARALGVKLKLVMCRRLPVTTLHRPTALIIAWVVSHGKVSARKRQVRISLRLHFIDAAQRISLRSVGLVIHVDFDRLCLHMVDHMVLLLLLPADGHSIL